MLKSLIFCFLIALTYSQSSSKCRVLVLQSGNDFGAYQAGAFMGLISNLPAEDVQYDYISGVGVGALNAFWLSFFPKGEESKAAQFLQQEWINLKSSDIYSDRKAFIVDKWMKYNSLYDSTPLQAFISNFSNYQIQRGLSFGACDASNGEFLVFDENSERNNLDIALAGALSSIPDFQYVQLGNYSIVDGTFITTLDAASPIERCQEEGFNVEDIIVDVIMLATTGKIEVVDPSNYIVPQVIKRTDVIFNFNKGIDDLMRLDSDFSNIEFRYVVMPSSTFKDDKQPYDFTNQEIQALLSQGEADAKQAINSENILQK